MKRENLEINKNSKKLEINNISNIFFSNKNSRENTNTMKIEVTQKFIINEKEFSSREEASRYILEEIYKQGLEYIIQNPENFLSALREVTNPGNPEKSSVQIGIKPTLADISKYLKEKENLVITRLSISTQKAADWPVYIIISPDSSRAFRYTKKVHELYYEILEIGIENIISKYSYKL